MCAWSQRNVNLSLSMWLSGGPTCHSPGQHVADVVHVEP